MSRDFGDFQTPPQLVAAILEYLSSFGKVWTRALEPTCGRGNFIEGLVKQAMPPHEIQGIELQDKHVKHAQQVAEQSSPIKISIKHANLFELNLQEDLRWNETGPLLVIGNPPWVTNSELGSLGSTNLPHKTNIKGLQGIEARTGKANFDRWNLLTMTLVDCETNSAKSLLWKLTIFIHCSKVPICFTMRLSGHREP